MVKFNVSDLIGKYNLTNGKRLEVAKFGKPAKKKKGHKGPKYTDKEDTIQGLSEDLLGRLGLPFIRIHDLLLKAVSTSPAIDKVQKVIIARYIKGLPDLNIFHNKIMFNKGKYRLVLPLELKREDGELSTSQGEWQDRIGSTITWNWEEAKKEILEFYNYKLPGGKNGRGN